MALASLYVPLRQSQRAKSTRSIPMFASAAAAAHLYARATLSPRVNHNSADMAGNLPPEMASGRVPA